MLKQKTVWEIVTPELHPVVAKMIEAGVAAKCAIPTRRLPNTSAAR